jgi:hypothetical protein
MYIHIRSGAYLTPRLHDLFFCFFCFNFLFTLHIATGLSWVGILLFVSWGHVGDREAYIVFFWSCKIKSLYTPHSYLFDKSVVGREI